MYDVCRYARLAPSVHNVQPWEFLIDKDLLTIRPNKTRILEAGDPVGRETWISLGACAETAIIAASHHDYSTKITHVAQSGITIRLTKGTAPDVITMHDIESRFSDRSVYRHKPIDASTLEKIRSCWHSNRIELVVDADSALIKTVADLTGRGMTMAMQSAAFRNELSGLINRPLTRKSIGFSRKSLRVGIAQGMIQPWLAKSKHAIRWHKKEEAERILSAGALVMTFSKGDTLQDWFESGRAYQRAGLMASRLGLRQATTAAVVEAADFHTDIEKIVGTEHRLQTMMRVGYSSKNPVVSPRIPTAKLIKSAT